MRILAAVFGIVLILAFSTAFLGAEQIKISMEEQSSEGEVIASNTIYADKNNGVHIEFKDSGQHGGIVLNIPQEIFWMIDYIEQTYFAITKEDAEKMKKMRQEIMPKMNAQQQKLQELFAEQMKDMPKEQQEAMKQSMPLAMGMGMGMNDEEEEIVFDEVGSESLDPWGMPPEF